MHGVRELLCDCRLGRHDNHAVGPQCKACFAFLPERRIVEAFVINEPYVDVEVAPRLHGLVRALFDFLPVSLLLVLRNEKIESVGFVVCQRTCIHVRLVVHLLKGLLHFLPCRGRHVGTLVEHSVYRSH